MAQGRLRRENLCYCSRRTGRSPRPARRGHEDGEEPPIAAPQTAERRTDDGLIPFPDVSPLVERAVEAGAQGACAAHSRHVAILPVPVSTTIVVSDVRARVADVTHGIGGGDGGHGVTRRGIKPVVVDVARLGPPADSRPPCTIRLRWE